jgi:group I intron endonuclease
MGTIYILENKINKKFYIGQTVQLFKERIRQHKKSNSLIGNALRKYGIDNFEITLIENIQEEELNNLEIEYIQKHNSISPNGYNLMSGGENGRHSKETKRKLSETHKGKLISEETRRKMSEAKKGKHLSEEHRKNLSKVGKGRRFSEEWKRKLSEAAKNRTYSEETRTKMSKSRKGKHHSEETRQKLSKATKEFWKQKKRGKLC